MNFIGIMRAILPYVKYSGKTSINYCTKINEKLHKAINEAEDLVGYSTINLMTELISQNKNSEVVQHIQNTLESDHEHPLIEAVQNTLSNNSPCLGVIVLLLSKASGVRVTDKQEEIAMKQRSIADIAEMIRLSHVVHKSINVDDNENSEKAQHDNKLAILSGDFMLGKSYEKIANLRNQNVNELLSSALRDLVESQFFGPRTQNQRALPVKPKNSLDIVEPELPLSIEMEPVNGEQFLGYAKAEWTLRNILNGAGLLGKACQSSLTMAGQSVAFQKLGYLFGKHLGLSWQARLDLEPFLEGSKGNFSLVCAPALFHLEHEPELYEKIAKSCDISEESHWEWLRSRIDEGPGFEKTLLLQEEHKDEALTILEQFPVTDEHIALKNIIFAL